MFEDRNMLKFVYALLGFVSIIISGPIVPVVSLIIAIALLVYKIKRAKESPEGFEALMLDIIIMRIIMMKKIIEMVGLMIMEIK